MSQKIDLEELEDVVALRKALRDELPGLTRINLRYSGTEPMVRLMLEADTPHGG